MWLQIKVENDQKVNAIKYVALRYILGESHDFGDFSKKLVASSTE